jgi:serine protease Do
VIGLVINRAGTEREVKVELRNRNGGRDVLKKEEPAATTSLKALGADFGELSTAERQQVGVTGGIKVTKIYDGKLAETDLEEGFIIVKANGKNVRSVKDLETIMAAIKPGEGLMLIGMYPNSSRMYYYAVPV